MRFAPGFSLLGLLFFAAGLAASALPAWGETKLAVVITVDQFPYSYLERFQDGLSEKGFFRRVASQGASFRDCNYDQAFTFTGPGHATIATGAYPRYHGVIDNAWYDRETQKLENCVADDTAETIGAPAARGASPRRLKVPTLGDVLKLETARKAKVFSIGYKDRAAILTAGRLADGVFWFDGETGRWVTSTAYRKDLPGYLRVINEEERAKQYAGQEWKLLHPLETYQKHRDDDDEVESPKAGMSRGFPHVLPSADDENYFYRLAASPFFNRHALAAAMSIVQSEDLGKDETPDLLYINLSSPDYVGHNFGPYSLEVEDMFYRLDIQLGILADDLDAFVGKDAWTIALTSDHGVAPIPKYAARIGLIDKVDALVDHDKTEKVLESQLSARFGELSEGEPSYVASVMSNQVYLRERHPNLAGANFAEAQRLARTILLAHPSVVAAATREELIAGGGNRDRLEGMLYRAFYPDHSGEVLFVQAPYQYYTGSYSASHGSPWRYDTHVPLMFLGNAKSGVWDRPVDPTAIAPTLARMLNVSAPVACQTHPLLEVLP